jgi:hypothetical protein
MGALRDADSHPIFIQGQDKARCCMPRTKPSRDAKAKLEAALDDALDDTFPASDPVAVGSPTGTEPPRAPVDRKAPLSRTQASTGR